MYGYARRPTSSFRRRSTGRSSTYRRAPARRSSGYGFGRNRTYGRRATSTGAAQRRYTTAIPRPIGAVIVDSYKYRSIDISSVVYYQVPGTLFTDQNYVDAFGISASRFAYAVISPTLFNLTQPGGTYTRMTDDWKRYRDAFLEYKSTGSRLSVAIKGVYNYSGASIANVTYTDYEGSDMYPFRLYMFPALPSANSADRAHPPWANNSPTDLRTLMEYPLLKISRPIRAGTLSPVIFDAVSYKDLFHPLHNPSYMTWKAGSNTSYMPYGIIQNLSAQSTTSFEASIGSYVWFVGVIWDEAFLGTIVTNSKPLCIELEMTHTCDVMLISPPLRSQFPVAVPTSVQDPPQSDLDIMDSTPSPSQNVSTKLGTLRVEERTPSSPSRVSHGPLSLRDAPYASRTRV